PRLDGASRRLRGVTLSRKSAPRTVQPSNRRWPSSGRGYEHLGKRRELRSRSLRTFECQPPHPRHGAVSVPGDVRRLARQEHLGSGRSGSGFFWFRIPLGSTGAIFGTEASVLSHEDIDEKS